MPRMLRQYCFILCQCLILACLISINAYATPAIPALLSPPPYAKKIPTLGRFNIGEVRDIFQDSQGNMWFGISEGLIRFDGFSAEKFSYEPNNDKALGHNYVSSITEGPNGNLWISTYGGGLYKYDPRIKEFSPIDLRLNPNDPPATNKLYDISFDQDGILWIGCDLAPIRYDAINNKRLPLPDVLAQGLPNKLVLQIRFDRHGDTWFSTMENGIYRFDGTKLYNYSTQSPKTHQLLSNLVRDLYEDSQGNIWIGTSLGLHKYDRKTDTVKGYLPSDHPSMQKIDNDIFAIGQDDKGHFWLGGVLNGLMKFNPDTEEFTSLSGKADIFSQYKASRVNAILKDVEGSLWLGTKQGLLFIPHKAQIFDYLSNSRGDLKVTDIRLSEDNKAYIAAKWSLYEVNLSTLQSEQILGNDPLIYRLDKTTKGNWLIGTAGAGIKGLDRKNKKLVPLNHKLTPAKIGPINGIYDVRPDNNNGVWVLPLVEPPLFDGGFLHYSFDNNELKWQTYMPKLLDIWPVSDKHLLLVSEFDGLYSYYPQTDKLVKRPFIKAAGDDDVVRFNVIYQDSKGRVWLGYNNRGLARFDIDTNAFKLYTAADGLLSNVIVSITEDRQGNLWLASETGLTRFNPEDESTFNIEQQDGLLFSSFYKRSALQLPDGRLAFGTFSGLLLFDPQAFDNIKVLTKPQLNQFLVLNHPVAIEASNDNALLKQSIEFTDEITLSAQDYLFSFDFTTTEYQRPDRTVFAYRMKGLDKDWIYTDASNRRATYTTLPPDDYVFEVKAANAAGQWTDQVASIKVTVLPPWYLTIQAIIAYVITLVVAIYLYIRRHTAKLKQQAKLLEDKVTERTEQLQKSRDDLAKQTQTVSELLAQKQRLFASVSHEFRTPLTLILSPVEQLLKRHTEASLTEPLSLVKRNGRRLLRMVDQLLEFAKLEQHNTSKPALVELSPTIDLLRASFDPLVANKQIHLSVEPCPEVTLFMLPDSLNKILLNILSNAYKYTQEGGTIQVSFEHHRNSVTIAVKDSGIGIAEKDQQAIFERFNRATDSHGEAIAGAGIGLALVKELIEANHGHIELQSSPGKGSTFIVTLPLATETQLKENANAQLFATQESLTLELDSAAQSRAEHHHLELPINNDELRKTILIIDDNADMRQLLITQLGEQYHCIGAPNGEEGLALAKQHMPDMVISDIMMPIMDGYELAAKLRADLLTCHMPIILLTAKGSVESRIKGLKLLVDDYLPKPFNLEELQLRIHNILSIRDIVAKRQNQSFEQDDGLNQLAKMGLNEVEQSFVTSIDEQLESHYQDSNFNTRALSEALSMSERQLHRKIKALFDISIPEIVRNYRLKKARELLRKGHRVSQVYFSVGFASHSYFSSCFKAKYGMTPSELQKVEG